MRRSPFFGRASHALLPLLAVVALVVVAAPRGLAKEDPAKPQSFATPEEAVKALVTAMHANDDAALVRLFGSGSEDLVDDGSDPIVRRDRAEFVADAKAQLAIEVVEEGVLAVIVGRNLWPLPTPIVLEDGRWRFDAEIARAEILARRIGANELEAIEVCRAYVDAQIVYGQTDWDGDEVFEFAQRIVSTPGERDGLFWPTTDGDLAVSPLGPSVASIERYVKDGPEDAPLAGYYWKVLAKQGANAPGGAHTYVLNGNMIAGFALVGTPAKYLESGVMTFVVSHHGKIFQRDLGKDSLKLAVAMEAYDPDEGWQEVDPNAPLQPIEQTSAR
jgi:hypothetical protein